MNEAFFSSLHMKISCCMVILEKKDDSWLGVIRLLNVKLTQTILYITLRLFSQAFASGKFPNVWGFSRYCSDTDF